MKKGKRDEIRHKTKLKEKSCIREMNLGKPLDFMNPKKKRGREKRRNPLEKRTISHSPEFI